MRSFLPPQWVLSCSFNQHPFLSFLALLLLPAVPASTFLTCGPAKPWHIPCCNNPSKNLLYFPCFWQLYPGKFCEGEILQIRNQERDFLKHFVALQLNFWSQVRIEELPYVKGPTQSTVFVFPGAKRSYVEEIGIHEACPPVYSLPVSQRWWCWTCIYYSIVTMTFTHSLCVP